MSGALARTAVSYIPTPFKLNAAVEGVKAVNETAGNTLAGLFDLMMADPEGNGLDNPYFTQNGHEGPSPKTALYFQVKKGLKVLSTMAVSIADVGGLASAAQSGAYGLIWYKLNALFDRLVPPSRRGKPVVYGAWYSWEVARKAVPKGSLETRMTAIMRQKMYGAAGGATKAGITWSTGGITGYFVSSASAVVAPYLDSLFGQDIQTLAQGLHWFAYLELVIGRGQGVGPALRILEVIWTDIALGRASMPAMRDVVREPRGWLVIADLLA
ncbi:MAG: hypothetical protein KGL55_02855 [Rhodospirillales bacterium]|nr:hypothetical protein [Rhodospirillales bacterium]